MRLLGEDILGYFLYLSIGENREPFFLYKNQYIIFRAFPVSTGMNRKAAANTEVALRVPRIHGDEPRLGHDVAAVA